MNSCLLLTTIIAALLALLSHSPLKDYFYPTFAQGPPTLDNQVKTSQMDHQQDPTMISSLARKSTVAVVGGSYVGLRFAKSLAASLPQTHKVVIVENNTHFNHLFTFPRFAVLPRGGEEKAFVPYSNVFDECPPGSGRVIQAKALSIHANEKANEPGYLQLDKEVDLDGEKVDRIPFDYLALATGTRLQVPWSMPSNDKTTGVKTLRETQDRVAKAKKIVIVGGGAVGVQVAFDISQLYQLGDDKVVTLVHSRDLIMNKFHPDLHKLVSTRLAEGGVQTKLGARVSLPASGYPDFKPGQFFKVELQNGDSIEGDLVLLCTGQTPRSDLLGSFSPSSITSGGFINVGPTLQVQAGQEIEAKAGNLDYKTSSLLDRIYALGDVADSGAPKTVRAAMGQVETVRANILASIKAGGKGAELKKFTPGPAGIHLTLGLKESVKFGNPQNESESPRCLIEQDGTPDMNVIRMWNNLNVQAPSDFHI